MDERQICQKALDTWGIISQLDMTTEECAELIKAINKWKRGKLKPEQVMEEVVDVHLMNSQMRLILNNEPLFEQIKLKKLRRLQKKLRSADAISDSKKSNL